MLSGVGPTAVGQYTGSQHLHSLKCSPEATCGATVNVSHIEEEISTSLNREEFVTGPSKHLIVLLSSMSKYRI
jgi:hypothetical protein